MPLTPEVLAALAVYAFVASATPGPNNMMLMASGVNFGFRRTLPHMLGIGIGFVSLLLGVGFGLGALLHTVPVLHLALKIAGTAYLLYLAWRIATATGLGQARNAHAAQPMTFLEAATFQWINPKAWVMAVTAMALYTSTEAPILSVIVVSGVFAIINVPCVSVWAGFGVALRQFLSEPKRLRIFNIAMGVALALSAIPMLL